MRALIPLMLAACTGSPGSAPPPAADPTPDPEPAAEAVDTDAWHRDATARALAKMPPQGVPPLDEIVDLAEVGWSGSTWTLTDGRTLAFDEGGADLGDERLSLQKLTPSGGALGERRVQALTDCALVIVEGDALIGATRVSPPCPEAARGYADPTWRFATVQFAGGDHYTFLPDGLVWRHGEGRAFKHPRGRRGDGADVFPMTFGESDYEVRRLDGCHVVMVHETDRAFRGRRSFPACTPTEASYDALAWSLWTLPDGTTVDLRTDAGHLDWFDRPGPAVRREATLEGGTVSFAGDSRLVSLVRGEGCTATATLSDGSTVVATRTWPACD